MSMFWVYAALLTATALAILITPLLRNRSKAAPAISRQTSNLAVFRDQLAELDADLAAGTIVQEQWEAARADLQRGLLEDTAAPAVAAAPAATRSKAVAIVVAIAVPLIAVSVYLVLGAPQGLDPSNMSAAQGAPHELTQAQIESMVARLAQRLESKPDDIEGWIMLARTYSALGRHDEAARAYAKADTLFPQNAQLLADYADSLAMAQGQSLAGKPEALVQRALKADGNNLKALALAGTVEFEKQNFVKAIEYWNRILPLLPADSEMGKSVRASIKEAEDKQGGVPVSRLAQADKAEKSKPTAAPAAASGARLSGTIKLAPALAAVRVKVKDLPLAFSFDDSMAMSPEAKLSNYSDVVVAARVSKSGNVMPEPGDLEGVSKTVHPGTTGMTVEIAKEIR